MKVLLLSVKAGYGHHSTAKAIIEYFEKNGHECYMLDIFDYINHRLGNSVQDGYLITTKYLPKAYGKAYGKMSKKDTPYDRHSLMSMLSKFVSGRLSKFIEEYKPDLMIGTHSYAGVCMSILEDKGVTDCPTIGIVTDYTVHPFWESSFLDYYIIPDLLLADEMAHKGISKEKLLPFGIPVREQFSKKTDKKEARDILGIQDIPTALVMMGSMGFGNIKQMLSEMDISRHEFQILCVCGLNEKIKKAVDEHEWIKKVYSYGFVENVDVMMDASDFIITKPGGLTTSEALAKGLPMITMNPIPGHEDRNLNFLVNTGTALMVNKNYRMYEALNLIFEYPWKLQLMRESVQRMGKPDSTSALYDFACSKLFAKSTVI